MKTRDHMRRWLAWLPGFGQGGHSLSRQLLLWVLLPQVVLWMAGGVAAYRLAAGYVNDAIDTSLLQASRALARQLKPIGTGLLIDFPKAAQDVLEADPDDRLMYKVSSPPGNFILGQNTLPGLPQGLEAPQMNQPYFYDARMPIAGKGEAEHGVRVAALFLRFGEGGDDKRQTLLVQVARSSTWQKGLARQILFDMLLPLSSLVLLMTVIVWLGIRAGLAPLHRLRLQVEGRAPTDLAPLQLASAPRELWSLAGAINGLLAAVQHNVEAQKRFIGDAAHQLRTPLAGLKSQTELALTATQDPELCKRLQYVHESATRSTRLVGQLLTLARAEPESVLAQDRHRMDVHALAQKLTAENVPKALRMGIDLGVDERHAEPAWVKANELLLSEALVNVLENAIQYSGRGSTVTVGVFTHDDAVTLQVEDDGPGIAPEDRQRVMERFVRVSQEGAGCGLGLAIVKEIVERHGGHVRLEGVQPHGLRVLLTLPKA